jgi:hypothetical protein
VPKRNRSSRRWPSPVCYSPQESWCRCSALPRWRSRPVRRPAIPTQPVAFVAWSRSGCQAAAGDASSVPVITTAGSASRPAGPATSDFNFAKASDSNISCPDPAPDVDALTGEACRRQRRHLVHLHRSSVRRGREPGRRAPGADAMSTSEAGAVLGAAAACCADVLAGSSNRRAWRPCSRPTHRCMSSERVVRTQVVQTRVTRWPHPTEKTYAIGA